MTKHVEEGLTAWANDYYGDEFNRTPLPQVDVVPLVCVWALAAARDKLESKTTYDFTQAVTGHDQASYVWSVRARRAHALIGSSKELPLQHLRKSLSGPDIPHAYRFDAYLLNDGRPQDDEHIGAVEYSLIQALGHAMYNSTSGGTRLSLQPLGPHPAYPRDFLNVSGRNVNMFVNKFDEEVDNS